jgi:hypothetical protein
MRGVLRCVLKLVCGWCTGFNAIVNSAAQLSCGSAAPAAAVVRCCL